MSNPWDQFGNSGHGPSGTSVYPPVPPFPGQYEQGGYAAPGYAAPGYAAPGHGAPGYGNSGYGASGTTSFGPPGEPGYWQPAGLPASIQPPAASPSGSATNRNLLIALLAVVVVVGVGVVVTVLLTRPSGSAGPAGQQPAVAASSSSGVRPMPTEQAPGTGEATTPTPPSTDHDGPVGPSLPPSTQGNGHPSGQDGDTRGGHAGSTSTDQPGNGSGSSTSGADQPGNGSAGGSTSTAGDPGSSAGSDQTLAVQAAQAFAAAVSSHNPAAVKAASCQELATVASQQDIDSVTNMQVTGPAVLVGQRGTVPVSYTDSGGSEQDTLHVAVEFGSWKVCKS